MLSILAAAFAVGFVVAIPPGAVTVVASNIAVREKLFKSFVFIFGAFCADIFYLFIVYLGVSSFLFQDKTVKTVSLTIMGIILLLLAIDAMRYKKENVSNKKKNEVKTDYLKTFVSGVLITLLNPITIAGWFGVAGSFFAHWNNVLAAAPAPGVLSIFFIMLGVSAWIFPLLTVLHRMRRFFTHKVIYIFSLVSGIFLSVLAVNAFRLALSTCGFLN
jgi:L-lysine exporter family protein LysE/ArgO